MDDARTAIISIRLPRHVPGAAIPVPTSVPQDAVDQANAESRRRIVEAYDTGMRVVAEQLRDLVKRGWRPDRESIAAFCSQIEDQTPNAKR